MLAHALNCTSVIVSVTNIMVLYGVQMTNRSFTDVKLACVALLKQSKVLLGYKEKEAMV